MRKHRDREITAMQNPRRQRLNQATPAVTTADGCAEGAVVAVEIGIALRHFDEGSKIFLILESTFGGAVSRDDVHAAIERSTQDFGIGIFGPDHRHGVLAASMGEQRQFGLSHSLPKWPVLGVITVDVMTIGQKF